MKHPPVEEKITALISATEIVLQNLESMVQQPRPPEQLIYYHAMIIANKIFRAQLYDLLGDRTHIEALMERNNELLLQNLQGGNA